MRAGRSVVRTAHQLAAVMADERADCSAERMADQLAAWKAVAMALE
jgi:hypothetical protein